MLAQKKIAVVIPCYRVARHVGDVIKGLPGFVDHIIVVDDGCPEDSGLAAQDAGRPVEVISHGPNMGVGAAVVTGYRRAMEAGADVVVKIDGDGQMNPLEMERLLEPIIEGRADYTKGNRFADLAELRQMPRVRLFGNSALSFLIKLSSGYWNIMDPTNGYTAITAAALSHLNLDRLSRRYFFESDMLINLNISRAVVEDVEMPARYGGEPSSLSPLRAALSFPPRLIRGLVRRVVLRYFVYDFNMASVYIALGLPMFTLSAAFGFYEWVDSFLTGTPKSAGTIMASALPIIVSFQMLLQAVNIDIASVPRKKSG